MDGCKQGMDRDRQMCFRRFSVLLKKAAAGRGTHTQVKGSEINSGSWSLRGYCWTRWGWEDGRDALGVGSGESVAGGVGHQGRSLSQQCWEDSEVPTTIAHSRCPKGHWLSQNTHHLFDSIFFFLKLVTYSLNHVQMTTSISIFKIYMYCLSLIHSSGLFPSNFDNFVSSYLVELNVWQFEVLN